MKLRWPSVMMEFRCVSPQPASYPLSLKTIGDHIRKRRLDLRLLQKEVAEILKVSTDCITNWEMNHAIPQIQYMPRIINFLDYNPSISNGNALRSQIRSFRIKQGLSHKRMGKILKVNPTTVGAWESGKSIPSKKANKRLQKLLKDYNLTAKR